MMRAQLMEFTATRARRPAETLVAETGFHHGLAVVEVSLDRQIMDIVTQHRGHLPALHIRHPVVRMQDKNIDVLAALTALYRR